VTHPIRILGPCEHEVWMLSEPSASNEMKIPNRKSVPI
jgi:hypothetical protein